MSDPSSSMSRSRFIANALIQSMAIVLVLVTLYFWSVVEMERKAINKTLETAVHRMTVTVGELRSHESMREYRDKVDPWLHASDSRTQEVQSLDKKRTLGNKKVCEAAGIWLIVYVTVTAILVGVCYLTNGGRKSKFHFYAMIGSAITIAVVCGLVFLLFLGTIIRSFTIIDQNHCSRMVIDDAIFSQLPRH